MPVLATPSLPRSSAAAALADIAAARRPDAGQGAPADDTAPPEPSGAGSDFQTQLQAWAGRLQQTAARPARPSHDSAGRAAEPARESGAEAEKEAKDPDAEHDPAGLAAPLGAVSGVLAIVAATVTERTAPAPAPSAEESVAPPASPAGQAAARAVPGLPASFGVAAFFRSRTAAPAVVPIRADAVADASAEARIDASAAGSATLNKDAARQTADAGPGPGPLPRSTESPLPAPAHPSSPASHGSDTHAAPRLTPGNEPARSGSSAAAEQAAPAGPLPAAALPAPPDPVTGQGTHAAKTNLLAAPIAMNDADPAASEPAAEQETPVQLWGGLVVRAPVAHAPLEPATPAQRPEDRKGSSGDTSGNMDAIDNSGPVLHSTADPVGEPSAPHARDAAPAPPVSDQLAGEIMARAQWSSHNGQTEFRVRLDPPELGTVRVHLTVNDQTITAKVVVASDATRQLIESQVDHLRQTLADAGVSLGRFDVSRDGGGAWHGTGHPQQPEPIPNYGPPAMSRPVAATAWQPASRASLGGIDVLI